MKFNKWTLGLAAIGVVSLASANQAKADAAPAPNYMESATKGISISGYVDTSVDYQGTEDYKSTPIDSVPFFTPSSHKRDGFNLDVIELNIEKDVDASPWSSGFKVQLLAGPDEVGYNSSGGGGDTGLKQAYVELMAPVGNGLDIKIGEFDTIIGYEVFEAGNNPNFTRSWGWNLEPTENTGVLLTYKFSDMVSASVGVANTAEDTGINGRDNYHGVGSYWWKAVMASVTVTAPSNWGFMSGSSFYLGGVNGFNGGSDQLNLYTGAVLNTPIKELTTGIAFDFVQLQGSTVGPNTTSTTVGPVTTTETTGQRNEIAQDYNFGLYATYKATDKLSFNGRAEYGWHDGSYQTEDIVTVTPPGTTTATFNGQDGDFMYYGLTGTVEYDLWANVMSRLEARYEYNNSFNGADASHCGIGLYLNVIYKF